MTNALDVQNLTVQYTSRRGPVTAVDDVSISVAPGEWVAVVGETGSGKTTAALASIGLLPRGARRVTGQVKVGGVDITGWSDKRLRQILGRHVGLIPQDPTASLDPLQTIGSQVTEAARIHHGTAAADDTDVPELLARVGLADARRIARSYPHELSGGQRQRALIAGAIALRPGLLVADEATSALDVTVQRRILDLLDGLRGEDNTGILFVTHDLAVAAERADRVIVLKDGRIQDSGPFTTLLTSPSGYTRQLIADAPTLTTTAYRDLPSSTEPVIDAAGVTKVFHAGHPGEVRALTDVSLTVTAGATHAIVGESGSGKSTLARIALGFTTPDRGEVRVLGANLSQLRGTSLRAHRRHVQMVYQSPYTSLDPRRTVLQSVVEPLLRFGLATGAQARRSAHELLERVALPEQLHHRLPRELSGGQRQRVAIARALAPQPQVIVLDEPVSALDVTVQTHVLRLLDDLQHEHGISYLLITHDLSVVRQLASTVTVLAQGRVMESGAVRDVFEHPTHPYTTALLEAIPRPAHTAVPTEGPSR